jgi:type VI secretion system protein VasJ
LVVDSSDNPYLTLGADPISTDSPCGENIRYEPVFEQLEAELAKQESLTAETVDWNRVADICARILKESSKDMLVGAYLCQSLLIRDGYSGLAAGLAVIADMVETHWDCLFPPAKRMRARQTAMNWLAEKAGAYVSEHAPTAAESQAAIDAAGMIVRLDAALVEKMADQAPMLTELSRPLKNYKQSADAELARVAAAEAAAAPREPAASEQTTAASAAPAATAAAPAPAPARERPRAAPATAAAQPVEDVGSDADAKKVLRQVQDTCRKAAAFWYQNKLADPRAYRISRLATWLTVEVTPPANEGVTQIVPPAADRIKRFDTQIANKEYSAVLPELEQTLSRAPFWLDGQNKVVSVLRAMGGEYEAAAATVIRETRNFLERLPAVIDLSFSDNSPFASDQTKMWINAEVLSSGESGASSSAGTSSGGAGAWVAALAEARKKAAGGDTEAAMAVFNQGIATAGKERDRFYWRVALAELLLQTGNAEAAAGLLVQMADKAKENRLHEWEPDLVARIYNLLYQSYRKQQSKNKDDKTLAEKLSHAYEQLCWLDPVTALTAKGD